MTVPDGQQPISPASSGSLRIGTRSTSTLSPFRITAARPIANSPIRLARNPPPTTMRSVSRQALSLRKRRTTDANSRAKSSIAPCTTPAASRSLRSKQFVERLPADFFGRLLAERIVAAFAQRLAQVLQNVVERGLVDTIAEEALVVFGLEVVAVDLDRGQAFAAMDGQCWQSCGLVGHTSPRRAPR